MRRADAADNLRLARFGYCCADRIRSGWSLERARCVTRHRAAGERGDDGARHDRDFKGFLRHHQIVTDVWYKAYPGLTTYDLARNARIRAGLEQGPLTGAALTRWLAEI